MARNEEKGTTMFSKWIKIKEKEDGGGGEISRPNLAQECDSVEECEKWRRGMIRDIIKKITVVKNADLGEHRIRELNDEINKLMRTKQHWEKRIRYLGGDTKYGKQEYDVEGEAIQGKNEKGYKYYGAAKDLPGVRELFEQKRSHEADIESWRKKSRKELMEHVKPNEYFARNTKDLKLMEAEEEVKEKELLESAVKAFQKRKAELISEVKASKGASGIMELAKMSDEGAANENNELQAILEQHISATAAASASAKESGSDKKKSKTDTTDNDNDTPSLMLNTQKSLLLSKYL